MSKYILFPVFLALPFVMPKLTPKMESSSLSVVKTESSGKFQSPIKIMTSGCYYTKPRKVLEKTCNSRECRAVMKKHLNSCVAKSKSKMVKKISYKDQTETTPFLTKDIIDDVLACISKKEKSDVSAMFPYQSLFKEVDYPVRSKHFEKEVTCRNEDCSRSTTMHMRPFIGKTKNLFYTF